MTRRKFAATGLAAAWLGGRPAAAQASEEIDAAWFTRARRFAPLATGRTAYVEYGRGPAALFLHGYPLNGFQWRGAIERLSAVRRCIAPDMMALGYTEATEAQSITPATQVDMLAALLDALRAGSVDIVANDSGGIVAQLFTARFPGRVRSLLLTNCDVDRNNPPPQFLPLVELARKGLTAEQFIMPQLNDKTLARSSKGIGGLAFTNPDRLSDETIEMYFRPLVATPLRRSQLDAYTVALGENVLSGIRAALAHWKGPARMVWGTKDALFGVEWAEWLDRTLPGSRGVKRVEANLFFPEEMPETIAAEARSLWTGSSGAA